MKTIQDLEVFDTVWVKEKDILYEGWIFDINKKHIIVTVPKDNYKDYRFVITRPLSQTELNQNGHTLLFNKPCIQGI